MAQSNTFPFHGAISTRSIDVSVAVLRFGRSECKDAPPASVGSFFREKIAEYLAVEPDPDCRRVKRALCDWFVKWEQVDNGVDDLDNQVQVLNTEPIFDISCSQCPVSWGHYIDYSLEGAGERACPGGGLQQPGGAPGQPAAGQGHRPHQPGNPTMFIASHTDVLQLATLSSQKTQLVGRQ